jgi:FMN phosphatase YigB (HAD superfamily)
MSIVEETPQVPFQVRGDFGDPGHHAPAIRDIFGPRCFQLYPDIRPVLSALKTNGFRLAVIANRHRGLDFFCFEMNLLAFLDAVISSADIGIEKPDSRIFNEAERRLNVKPERIVHIGDLKDDDFRGALAAESDRPFGSEPYTPKQNREPFWVRAAIADAGVAGFTSAYSRA